MQVGGGPSGVCAVHGALHGVLGLQVQADCLCQIATPCITVTVTHFALHATHSHVVARHDSAAQGCS